MEKLLESGQAVNVRDRHLAHFMEVSRRAQEHFGTAQRLMWVNRLEVEHDNIRSALGWALESDPASALQMVCSLAGFWLSRSYMTEGHNWCQAAISRAEALSTAGPNMDLTRAQAYSALAMLSINHGDHQTGQTAARKAVALARQLEDAEAPEAPLQLARALHFLGMSSAFLGDATLAFDSLHESEALCRKFGYKDELANVLQSLAYVTLEIHGSMDQMLKNNYSPTWRKAWPCLKAPWTLRRRYGPRAYWQGWHSIVAIWLSLENMQTLCLIYTGKWEISSVSPGIRARWHMSRGRSAIIRKR